MLIDPPPPFRRRPARVKAPPAAPPPPQGPVLTDADFSAGKATLTLFFDRDVAVDGFNPAAIMVDDPPSGSTYRAAGASVVSGLIAIVQVTAVGPSTGTRTVLDATAASGIVAQEDGTPWAGVADLTLPFP